MPPYPESVPGLEIRPSPVYQGELLLFHFALPVSLQKLYPSVRRASSGQMTRAEGNPCLLAFGVKQAQCRKPRWKKPGRKSPSDKSPSDKTPSDKTPSRMNPVQAGWLI